VMDDLIETTHRTASDKLELDTAQAVDVLDLEDIITTRWQDNTAIAAHVARFAPPPTSRKSLCRRPLPPACVRISSKA
jgi:hypothetical protein